MEIKPFEIAPNESVEYSVGRWFYDSLWMIMNDLGVQDLVFSLRLNDFKVRLQDEILKRLSSAINDLEVDVSTSPDQSVAIIVIKITPSGSVAQYFDWKESKEILFKYSMKFSSRNY